MSDLKNGFAFGSSELFNIRPFNINARYLLYFFMTEAFKDGGVANMTGVAGLQRVSSAYVRNAILPLPPEEEQIQIVSFLDKQCEKGVFKQYIRRRYNDGNVRGAIDIARHIERNTPFTGSVAYSQREFSYDNYLTELVRHTIEFIKRKPYGNNLLIKVKDEVKLIVDATPSYERYDCQKIIEANKKKAVRHAYFREYLALQRLCLLILQHQKHQIGAGSKQIYGILFDGAWLWEEYIGSLVDNVFYHPMNKAGKGAQRLFGGNIGLIYPDFISRDHETRVIADAKYKPLDNIGNKDYLQVLAYMLRFDAMKGYYLYPEAEGADDLQLWLNKGSTYEANVVPRDDICIIKHGLKIPIDAENYESFVSKMQVSESEFRQVFIG